MLRISKQEVEALRANKMGKFITIINRTHGSRAKTYYAVEDQRVRNFLQRYHDAHVAEGRTGGKKKVQASRSA